MGESEFERNLRKQVTTEVQTILKRHTDDWISTELVHELVELVLKAY